MSPVLDARNNILSVMPRIMACLAALWRAVTVVDRLEELPTMTLGAPKVGLVMLCVVDYIHNLC